MSFQLFNLSGNADLYVNFGLPFPSLDGTFIFASVNPGTNDEQVLVVTNSALVALGPGQWYVGVFNADTNPVTYTLLANEYTVAGTNIILVNVNLSTDGLSLTWASTSGLYYWIEGAADPSGAKCVPLSRTLVATGLQTSFTIPFPSPFQYFLINQGTAPATNLPPVSITGVWVLPTGTQLQWQAGTNSQFQVQWSPALAPIAWSAFPVLLTSPTGAFSFLDDGSLTGGLDPVRFYRLIQLP